MMSKVTIHILRSFGHPNQVYTTTLLAALSKQEGRHVVVCDQQLTFLDGLDVWEAKVPRWYGIRPSVMIRALYRVLFDRRFKQAFSGGTFKKKLRHSLKWDVIFKINPAVIHVHHLQVVSEALLQYLKGKGALLLVSLRGMELLRETNTPERQDHFLKVMGYFSKVHVISEFMKHFAHEQGIARDKLFMVRRGYAVAELQATHLKKTHVIEGSVIRLLSVGRLDWEKGHDSLIMAVGRLKQRGYALRLDIYGEGILYDYLLHTIALYGLKEEVCLKGFVPNEVLKGRYRDYDVAVQPSRFEALSNGLMDLCFHNMPCVVSNVGGMPEIIAHGVNGMIFDLSKPESLDQAILDCLVLNSERLIKHNISLQDQYLLEREVEGLEQLYN